MHESHSPTARVLPLLIQQPDKEQAEINSRHWAGHALPTQKSGPNAAALLISSALSAQYLTQNQQTHAETPSANTQPCPQPRNDALQKLPKLCSVSPTCAGRPCAPPAGPKHQSHAEQDPVSTPVRASGNWTDKRNLNPTTRHRGPLKVGKLPAAVPSQRPPRQPVASETEW